MNPLKTIKSILPVIFISISVVLLMTVTGCEGPEGPAGVDGIAGVDGVDGVDGADGNLTCISCHNSDVQQENRFAYNSSQHASGSISLDYAGGRASCARCHGHEGFVEFMTTGSVADNIGNPTQITCQTCHSLHTTFDSLNYALRTDGAPVDYLLDDSSYDVGEGTNLCATCHQPRRGYSDYDDESHADSAMVTSTHAGPHHGPQSAVLSGMAGDDRLGSVDITALGAGTHESVGCNGCHMHKGDDLEVGGHTFWPNVDKCGTCHAGASDFDINSYITDLDVKIATLQAHLVAASGQGIERVDGVWSVIADSTVHGILHLDSDGAAHPAVGQFERDVFSAFWNYMVATEDKSHGVHNPNYVEALIDNALEAF